MLRPLIPIVCVVALTPLQPPADPDPPTLARSYTKLKDLIPAGYQTNARLSALCRGVWTGDIRRKEKTNGPHTYSVIHVYADRRAERALKQKARVFPVGATLIKEKLAGQVEGFAPGRELPLRRNGVTGMIKRAPGYDPRNGDWEYFIQEEGGRLETGRIATCVGCHAKAKGPDHLFATWYGKKPGPD